MAPGALPPWPPPGLERVQGDLFGVASRAALAGAFLVIPLLFVVTRDAGFATLGPLADAWWVSVALATVGLAFGLDAVARTARTLRRASEALEGGYAPATILQVLADAKRDMGFLLSGTRHFTDVAAVDRDAIWRIRVFSALLLALAGLWLSAALAFGLLFAARGLLSPLQLEFIIIVPALAGYLFGGLAYLIEERRVRRARKEWYAKPSSDDATAVEVRRWHEAVAGEGSVAVAEPPAAAAHRWARLARSGGVAVGLLAIAIALPVLTLVPASAVGPVLTTVSAPAFESYRPRAARAEAFRSYAVGADPSVSSEDAGRILHSLAFVASNDEPGPGERMPESRVAEPWIPGGAAANPLGLDPSAWGDSLFERVSAGLGPEAHAYLAEVASHPLMGDFARLARSPALDAAAGRWETPFPAGLTMATLPVPQFGTLRSAANARIAAAAYAFVEGRLDDAEEYLSEVIAVGFLMADDGPTLIDNLVGYAIVEAGGEALEDFYRVARLPSESAQLSRLRDVADRSARMIRTRYPQGQEAWVRRLPDLVLDTTLVRGVRWEHFINLATMAPCLNVNRIVFGTDDDYDEFVVSARSALVRWPSEEPLFDLARRGWIGPADPGPPSLLERVASLYMSTGENSCVGALRHVGGAGGL